MQKFKTMRNILSLTKNVSQIRFEYLTSCFNHSHDEKDIINVKLLKLSISKIYRQTDQWLPFCYSFYYSIYENMHLDKISKFNNLKLI